MTSEAGLNDGLAFPFVALAIAAAASGGLDHVSLAHWLVVDVLWKIAAGAILGALVGAALGWLTFHVPHQPSTLVRTGDGFVALGAACLAYGIVQAVDGYGFVGVFAAAVALRSSHRESAYHERMHDYAEELERLLIMVLLVCFGAALAAADLLKGLTWPAAAFSVTALLLVRPLEWMAWDRRQRPQPRRAGRRQLLRHPRPRHGVLSRLRSPACSFGRFRADLGGRIAHGGPGAARAGLGAAQRRRGGCDDLKEPARQRSLPHPM